MTHVNLFPFRATSTETLTATLVKETTFSTVQKSAATPAVTTSNTIITTVAGSAVAGRGGDGGRATASELSYPEAVAVDASGNIYIADRENQIIRMVTKSTGIITTVAGNGLYGYNGDGGQAMQAQLSSPQGVAVDASGNIYIADTENHRIRMVTKSTGIISTVAGSAESGFRGDGGQATLARLLNPHSVVVDASGNIYIADASNLRIRVVTKSTGVITTVAGNGQNGFSGDGGYATSAVIVWPQSIAVDTSGNIYIADANNRRIRKVTKSTGIITTVVGTGQYGNGGDGGYATSAQLSSPRGVAVDASGNIYISDFSNVIRMVTKSTGIISTVAGTGSGGFSGDGEIPRSAQVSMPLGIAVDAWGNIYIADTGNKRIRKVGSESFTAAPTLSPSISPTRVPTSLPTMSQTPLPTSSHTMSPTAEPTSLPIKRPTKRPTKKPTHHPTKKPTHHPTKKPTHHPTRKPISPVSTTKTVITTVAGSAVAGRGGDGGRATASELSYPEEIGRAHV